MTYLYRRLRFCSICGAINEFSFSQGGLLIYCCSMLRRVNCFGGLGLIEVGGLYKPPVPLNGNGPIMSRSLDIGHGTVQWVTANGAVGRLPQHIS